jgi:hypothetical protein
MKVVIVPELGASDFAAGATGVLARVPPASTTIAAAVVKRRTVIPLFRSIPSRRGGVYLRRYKSPASASPTRHCHYRRNAKIGP